MVTITRHRDPERAGAKSSTREGTLALETALIVPVRGPLFHQVKPTHAIQLQKEIGGRFQPFPPGWVARGDSVWTSEKRLYFEYGQLAGQMAVFELEPLPGWSFVRREHLDVDAEGGQRAELLARWKASFDSGKLPPNTFDRELQRSLEASGFPSHSDFYRAFKIAGFYKDDFRDRPKRSFVFVHHLGGQVRLEKSAHRR